MLNLDVSCQRSGTPPNKGFASLRHLLLSETIGSELFGFVGFRVWFSSCHNGFLLKNVILIKQKLLRKSYWFWQSCLEGSWGGISWKCWSSQLWHFLNGTEFWFISFSLFRTMFQNALFHEGGKKSWVWISLNEMPEKKEIKCFDWSKAVLQHWILQLLWLFGWSRMI